MTRQGDRTPMTGDGIAADTAHGRAVGPMSSPPNPAVRLGLVAADLSHVAGDADQCRTVRAMARRSKSDAR